MRITRAILVVLVLPVAAFAAGQAGLSKEQIYSLFDQANQAFRQANSTTNNSDKAKALYETAILSYEKIINDGHVKNPKLYYNLANTYFLSEDIGRAILNYRRAEKLDRTDADIQKNLAFAQSRRMDKVKTNTENRVLQTLFFWHYDFSVKTRFILACACFAILCIILSVMIWLGRGAPTMITAVVMSILLACFIVSITIESSHQASRICGVIVAPEVVARQGDGQTYSPSFEQPLHAGTEFDLVEQRQGWMHIKLSDESDGWIPQTTAELI